MLNSANQPRNQRICSLVAMTSQADQQLMARSLRASLSRIELIYSSTSDDILACLNTRANEYYNFPSLLLLDLEIATRPIAWQLLEQIRSSFPLLPVVLISLDGRLETIKQAYDLGVHGFVHRSMDWQRWEAQLASLADYWLQVVSLPKLPPL